MSIIDKMLKYDTCVYWALKSNESGGLAYDDYGQPQYTDPVELSCRWEDVALEFIDPKATRQVSRSIVYVESDVDVGGMLFHGVLTDLVDPTANPREEIDGAWEIRQFGLLPKLNYRQKLRTAFL